MIEDVIQLGRQRFEPDGDAMPGSLADKLVSIEEMLTSMSSRLTSLESGHLPEAGTDTVHVNRIGIQPPVQAQGLWVSAMKDLEIVLEPTPPPVAPTERPVHEQMDVDAADVESSIEEEAEDAVIDAVEEAEEEEEEAEEEQEEEDDEEAVELEEFQFKNTTYYRDTENQVYGLDADGELKDDPIGTWDVARQRVLFKRVA
jgi:hypothetical protein